MFGTLASRNAFRASVFGTFLLPCILASARAATPARPGQATPTGARSRSTGWSRLGSVAITLIEALMAEAAHLGEPPGLVAQGRARLGLASRKLRQRLLCAANSHRPRAAVCEPRPRRQRHISWSLHVLKTPLDLFSRCRDAHRIDRERRPAFNTRGTSERAAAPVLVHIARERL